MGNELTNKWTWIVGPVCARGIKKLAVYGKRVEETRNEERQRGHWKDDTLAWCRPPPLKVTHWPSVVLHH